MFRPRLMGLLLALITLLVYLPAADHGFSIFDDDDYVTERRCSNKAATWKPSHIPGRRCKLIRIISMS